MMPRSASIAILMALAGLSACTDRREETYHVGYVEAEYVYVAPPQNGWLETLNVREGDMVAAGDLLFSLDQDQQRLRVAEGEGRVRQAGAQVRDLSTGARPAEISALQARLEEARARLVYAESELERARPLVEDGVIAKVRGDQLVAERDSAIARVKVAEEAIHVARLAGREAAREGANAGQNAALAALEEAQWALDQRTIRALTGGRVEQVFHRQGEYIAAGSPVLALLPENALKVRFFVSQASLAHTQIGQVIRIRADGLTEPLESRISYIASEAEFTPPVIYSAGSREKLVFLVEARLPEGTRLRPGLPVDIDMK